MVRSLALVIVTMMNQMEVVQLGLVILPGGIVIVGQAVSGVMEVVELILIIHIGPVLKQIIMLGEQYGLNNDSV